jgi:protease PrsW
MAICNHCGVQCAEGERFCRNCGAEQTVVASAASATAVPAPAQNSYAVPPPGMVPVVYQAYPGGPQQVYYVPAQGTHAHAGAGFLESIQAQIRNIAGSDKLEGFSFKELFKDTFSRHGSDEVIDYLMVGATRTTPPIELVDTNWPKPWLFFRVMVALALGVVALWLVWHFTTQPLTIPCILFLGAFAVPLAMVVFIFEMNTPRNVPVVLLLELVVIGGVLASCFLLLEYDISLISNWPGIVEETAKLAAAILVVRSLRYKYELNGILIGAAVGAGYASFETCAYAMGFLGNMTPVAGSNGFLAPQMLLEMAKASVDTINAVQAQSQTAIQAGLKEWNQALNDALVSMVHQLEMRGLTSPFGHPLFTGIAAGAFWRVKQDKLASFSMLIDKRFLMAFAIPVLLHSLWDLPVEFPSWFNPTTQAQANEQGYILDGIQLFVAVVGWYVLFTMIQQGLHQVRDVKAAQLQNTLAHVEASLPPVAVVGTYGVQPLA